MSRDGNGAGKGAQPGVKEDPGGNFSLSITPDRRVEPGGIGICSGIMNGMKGNVLGLSRENFFNK